MKRNAPAECFVLDTSALVAFMEGEPGHERVAEILSSRRRVTMSEISFMELYTLALRKGGKSSADAMVRLCEQAGIVWLPIDRVVLLAAADLKVRFGLSLADAIVAGSALESRAVLVHRDREMAALGETIRIETLPDKHGR